MATVHTDHVGVLVVSEVVHLLGFLLPGVPDDGVRKVVFLDPHFPARHNVGHYVLVRSVDVNPRNAPFQSVPVLRVFKVLRVYLFPSNPTLYTA